ncbi:hypothetical protein ACT43C_14690 [Acinetobacter baumannii]
MKKPRIQDDAFDEFNELIGHDYKLAQQMYDIRRNFESSNIWLYLGGDSIDKSFAKIGITMGDLTSRSYSSARPTFYLFCAFKFKYNLTKNEVKEIEQDILSRIDRLYFDENGSKRLFHYESGEISECFQNIDFIQFYKDLHFEIINHHRNSFVICDYAHQAEYVYCIFNKHLDNSDNRYYEMILQPY